MKIDLKANPFFLSDDDICWVEKTLSALSLDEKVGQLFVPLGLTGDTGYLNHLINDCHVGGIMYRTGPKEEIRATHEAIQNMAKIPMLIAANT